MAFSEVRGGVTVILELLKDSSVLRGQVAAVPVEREVHHHIAFMGGLTGEKGAPRWYALAMNCDGIGEMYTLFGESVEVRSMGDTINKPHSLRLHLIAFQN